MKLTDARRDRLRELLTEWNPIGVDGLPPDEYDGMIRPVFDKLADGCNEEFLTRFLQTFLWTNMGFHPDPDRMQSFVRKACGWMRDKG